jgi:phage terminase large subunit-like protein
MSSAELLALESASSLRDSSSKASQLQSLSDAQFLALKYDWAFWGRPDQQMPPGDWFIWLIMTGRGWGKTRTATENISRMLRGPSSLIAPPGAPSLLSFVADTAFDMRQYSVEGPSGFLNVGPPDHRPRYRGAPINTLTWPNGAKALLFSAEDPEVTRGASGSFFWWDELAKARRAEDGWTNMLFGMREGSPKGIVTTTPRPIPLIKRLIKSPSTHLTVGSTWANRANLAPVYYKEVIEPLIGTRTGRQEIDAELLQDLPGALWTRSMIDDARKPVKLPDMLRIVVAVDPSGARDMSERANSHIGIVVAGRGVDGRGYVLADRSCKLPPGGWARQAIDAYHEFQADRLVAERNFGGAMVEHTIKMAQRSGEYVSYRLNRFLVGPAAIGTPLQPHRAVDHHFPIKPDVRSRRTVNSVECGAVMAHVCR